MLFESRRCIGIKKLHIIFIGFIILILITTTGCSKIIELSQFFTKERKVNNIEADRKLYDAILRDDMEGIDQALLEGADIDDLSNSVVDGIYTNPVAIALFEGQNRQIAKHLLEKGANPDQELPYGITVLTYAVTNDLYDLAEFMLENGAGPNVRDDINNSTAMDYAVQNIRETNNLIEMIELLLSYGAKPSTKTVAYLFTNYLDVIDDADNDDLYLSHEKYKVASYLVKKMSELKLDTGLDPALEMAVTGDSKSLLKYLEKGNVKDKYRGLTLEFAAAFCNKEVLSYMFEHGYSYNYRTADDSTLLMIAACGNNVETMSYLYELGIGIEEENCYFMQVQLEESKQTALFYAVEQQSYDAVKWLLEHNAIIGAGVDIKDKDHYLASELGTLSQNCDMEMLKIFVDYGYYISQKDAQEMIRCAESLDRIGYSNPNYDEFVSYVNSVVSKDE